MIFLIPPRILIKTEWYRKESIKNFNVLLIFLLSFTKFNCYKICQCLYSMHRKSLCFYSKHHKTLMQSLDASYQKNIDMLFQWTSLFYSSYFDVERDSSNMHMYSDYIIDYKMTFTNKVNLNSLSIFFATHQTDELTQVVFQSLTNWLPYWLTKWHFS